MDRMFKICITFKFSDFVIRSFLLAGGPYLSRLSVHNIICSLYINKTLTNQLVQYTRTECTGLLTFALRQRETHENYAHIIMSIYIKKTFEKSNCLTLVTQLI